MVCGTCGAAWLLGARAHTALKRGAGLRLHLQTKPTQDLRATTLYGRFTFTDYASKYALHRGFIYKPL